MKKHLNTNNHSNEVSNDKTFLRVTNQQIYDKLEKLESQIVGIHEQTLLTNGKVRTHTKWITGLTGAFGAAFIFIISILMRGG